MQKVPAQIKMQQLNEALKLSEDIHNLIQEKKVSIGHALSALSILIINLAEGAGMTKEEFDKMFSITRKEHYEKV